MQDLFTSLEQYKIADEQCAAAYEACTPQLRSAIKTAIAFHFSENPLIEPKEIFMEKSSSGFCKGYKQQALENLFIFIDKDYSAPAKLLALFCQAIQANVKQLFVFLDKAMPKQKHSLFLACLELCGIENSYTLPEKDFLDNFFKALQEQTTSPAKVISCSMKGQNFQEIKEVNTFADTLKVRVFAQNPQREMVTLAYGKSATYTYAKEEKLTSSREHFNALMQSSQKQEYDISFVSTEKAAQNYGLGMEFCFNYAKLPQDFFYDTIYFCNLETNYPAAE